MGLVDKIRAIWWLKKGGLTLLNWNALKSRKLIVLLAFVVAVGVSYYFAPPEHAPALVASLIWLAGTYFGVQGANDIAAAVKGLDKQGTYKSKKFGVTLGTGLLITILGQVGAPDFLIKTVQDVAMAFLGAQGAVDFTRVVKNGGVVPPVTGGGQ